MNIRSTKFWNTVGIVAGIAVIILGIVLASLPLTTFSTVSSEDVSFGGDFYTYQYKATRNAAINAAVTANNLREIGRMLSLYMGLAFVVAGVIITLVYLKKFFLEEDYYEDELSEEEIKEILENMEMEEEPFEDVEETSEKLPEDETTEEAPEEAQETEAE